VEDDLLWAVLERPWDDAPRLAYADLLMERGDPNGEMIRGAVLVGGVVRGVDTARGITGSPCWGFWSRGFCQEIVITIRHFSDSHRFLFERYPIVDVRVDDMAPHREDMGGGNTLWEWCRWGWRGEFNETCSVPQKLFDLLPGGENVLARDRRAVYFTREAARDALSRACVEFGRQAVGLPPLNWEKTG
jgi:uncharacterized protein (TIGR02996 family)